MVTEIKPLVSSIYDFFKLIRNFTTEHIGTEYLDAFTQTGPYFDKMKFNRYISRDTQTYEFKGKEIVSINY